MPTPSVDTIKLATASLGTSRTLTVRRYGTLGARPKVYMQASLHADELPGAVVLDHLERMLTEAQTITGQIVIVPVANPIGLDQFAHGYHIGRLNMDRGGNFNRDHADPAEQVLAAVNGEWSEDAQANGERVRSELRRLAWDALIEPTDETSHLRRHLHALSCDADIVLDLHCDNDANLHFYTDPANWPSSADLCAEMGIETILVAEESGDMPFDESHSLTWAKIRQGIVTGHPLPDPPLSGTVELRGEHGLSDDVSKADAHALYRFLIRRGVISGEVGPLPDLVCDATPLTGVEMLRTPVPGILIHKVPTGGTVATGDLVAEILDPINRTRHQIIAGTSGPVYGRMSQTLVRPNDIVAKIAGKDPLPGRSGKLLTD